MEISESNYANEILDQLKAKLNLYNENIRAENFESPADQRTAVAKSGSEFYNKFLNEHPDLVNAAQTVFKNWMDKINGGRSI